MKRVGPLPFDRLIEVWLSSNPELAAKFREARITSAWKEVMGQTVASQTDSVTLRGGTLMVRIKSPILRSELSMRRNEIPDILRETLGKDTPEKIVIR